ncbi:RHS repeat-associated core domain-containing protein [Paenibacillus sp. YPG26]|nr:RHS repeat-associated core domain-containing protein [Paenibacillus sp. YPG26]
MRIRTRLPVYRFGICLSRRAFRSSGELWDDTTKLQYLRARWYDPSVGRFINEDTYEGELNNPLTLNLYTYVHNNPLIYTDPTGHWATDRAANWTINEMKWKWDEAHQKNDKKGMAYWSSEAEKLRNQMRKAGWSEAEIMQSTDTIIPEDIVMEIAWASTFSWIENDPLGFGFLVWSADKMAYLSGGGGAALSIKNVTDGFIKHSVYNEVRNKIGKKGIGEFLKAMDKGFVRAEGEAGITRLTGQGTKINGNWYQYELKNISKEFGDYRIYGNWDDKLGKVVFTYFGRHKK